MNDDAHGMPRSGPATRPKSTSGSAPPGAQERSWVNLAGRYGLAVAAVALATALRWWLGHAYDVTATFLFHYPAVLLAASLAGGGPGALATLLSALAVEYCFLLPPGFAIAATGDMISLGIFTGAGLFLSGLAEQLRRSRWAQAAGIAREQALREARDRLEDRVHERTAELEEANRALGEQVKQRERAEQAARNERQRLNDVLEILPTYVVLLTPDRRVSFANRFFRERFGTSGGRCCFDRQQQRAEPCETCETYGVLQTHVPRRWEWTGPDGRDYDVHDFPFTDADGSPLILEMGIDITGRKQAQGALEEANRTLEQRVARRTAALTETADRLRESEERLRLLGDNLPESAVYQYVRGADGPGQFTYFSAGVERLNGVKVADVLRDTRVLHRQVLPEYLEQLLREEERCTRELCDFDMDVPMRRPDGELRWMRLHSRPRRAPDDRIIWDGVQTDVTDRKQAEAALQASEAQFRTLTEASPDCIGLHDRDLRHIYVNPAISRITGRPQADFVGKSVREMGFPPEAAAQLERHLQQTRDSARELTAELLFPAVDGPRYLQWRSVPILNEAGAVKAVLSVSSDITARKRAEEALRTSERRLIGVLESTPDAFVSFDADMRYTYVNANAERLQAARREELLGRDVRAIYPDAESRKTISQYEQVIRQQKSLTTTSYHAGFDRWVETRAFPTPDGVSVFYKDVSAHVKAEQALRESEARFRLALQNAPVTVAAQDRALRYIWAYNQRTAGPGEIIGRSDRDLFPPEQAERLTAIKRRVLDEGAEQREQMWLSRPDGDVFLDIYWEPIRDDAGRIIGVASAAVDLTPIKRAEEQLRWQTARLEEQSRIADLASLFIRNMAGRVIYWNTGTQQLYGYTNDEAVGVESQRLLQTVFPTPLDEIETTVLRDGRWEGELVHTRRDGTKLTVFSVWILHRDADGQPQAILEVNNDVSAVRKAEEARREAELAHQAEEDQRRLSAYHRSLIEASLDPLVTIDAAGKITDANAAAERVTGVARTDLIGTDFSGYFTEPGLARAAYEQAFREGPVQDCALEVQHRDGHCTPVLYNASVFRDDAGQVVGVFAAARDITVRRRVEEELRRLNEELEVRVTARTADLAASNKELEAFAYSVSHDLRAPLRAIDGFCQALVEEYADKLDPQGRNYLQRARAASQRMGQLIDGMLGLSRTTRVEMRRTKMNLSVLAKAIAADLKRRNPEREVEFIIAPNLYVSADASLLRAVLQNLLENAWKFTKKHQTARIEVGATQRDHETVYFVQDDGAGFDMTYGAKLFGAFQRLHGHGEFEGTGVGLATVQRIIHRHGGRVWAEGAVDQGATFYFTLPPEGRPT